MNDVPLALSDLLTFSADEYTAMIVAHNTAAWPVHLFAAAGSVGVYELTRTQRYNHAGLLLLVLALAWGYLALAYFLGPYAEISWASDQLALLSGIVAGIFLIGMLFNPQLREDSASSRAGHALVIFAVFLMPLLSFYIDRAWENEGWLEIALFGIGPSSTAVASVGAALVIKGFGRWLLALPPLAWAAYMYPLGEHVGDPVLMAGAIATLAALVIGAIGAPASRAFQTSEA